MHEMYRINRQAVQCDFSNDLANGRKQHIRESQTASNNPSSYTFCCLVDSSASQLEKNTWHDIHVYIHAQFLKNISQRLHFFL
jgi:hypothetical protein